VRAIRSGWVNGFATRRKRSVQIDACSGRLMRRGGETARRRVALHTVVCARPQPRRRRVGAIRVRRRERLGLAMGASRPLLDSAPWCAWWLRIGVRVVAVRRVRPAGASGTEWTLWTPGPCLGRARSLSLGVGLGRRVLTPRGDRACDPKHQLRTHVLQPASPVGGIPDGRDVPLALAVRFTH
jgi:hypothetical protein